MVRGYPVILLLPHPVLLLTDTRPVVFPAPGVLVAGALVQLVVPTRRDAVAMMGLLRGSTRRHLRTAVPLWVMPSTQVP